MYWIIWSANYTDECNILSWMFDWPLEMLKRHSLILYAYFSCVNAAMPSWYPEEMLLRVRSHQAKANVKATLQTNGLHCFLCNYSHQTSKKKIVFAFAWCEWSIKQAFTYNYTIFKYFWKNYILRTGDWRLSRKTYEMCAFHVFQWNFDRNTLTRCGNSLVANCEQK